MVPEHMLGLAPTDLPNLRSERYNGDGLGVLLDQLAPDDRALVRQVYDAVMAIATARPVAGQAATPAFVAAVGAVGADPFVRVAQALGEASVRAGAPPLVRKVLHDIRGGALTALVGTAGLLEFGPPDANLLATCGRLARDHCKIVRSAIIDLDLPGRAYDEEFNYHGIEKFVQMWDGVTVREYGRDVSVAVRCEYRGGITTSCLENAAVERVLYNHVNNAARHAADARVAITVFVVGAGRLVRWVVSNAVTAEHRAWLDGSFEPGLGKLYAAGVTSTGSGIGLASCVDFVAAAVGVTPEQALTRGYLGARLGDGVYNAWFHWPAFAPEPPPG